MAIVGWRQIPPPTPTLDIGLGLALAPRVRRRVGHAFPRCGFRPEAEALAANLWAYPELKVPMSRARYTGTALNHGRMRRALAAFEEIGWLEPAPCGLEGLPPFQRRVRRRGPKFGLAFPRALSKVGQVVPIAACLRWRTGKARCDAGNRQRLDCPLGWATCRLAERAR